MPTGSWLMKDLEMFVVFDVQGADRRVFHAGNLYTRQIREGEHCMTRVTAIGAEKLPTTSIC
jgi:hypothetical protein